MRATFSSVIAIAVLVVLCLPLRAEKAPDKRAGDAGLAIGEKAGNFTFKDIHYLPRTLNDFHGKKAFVIMFTTLDCPIVQRYLPKLGELDRTYRDRGAQFLAVNVAPNDEVREVAYRAMRANCEFPFAKDFDGDVVKALDASRAGEVVVLDADKKLRYRGRVDDQFRFGGERPNPSRDDLKLAIEDVLAGRDVAVAETPIDGCRITLPEQRVPESEVTYAEHVAPLLQKHCQDCHRPGAPEAPFALASFQDAVDHSDMIAEVVKEQRMPPWFGSKQHGHFSNYRGMAIDERHQLEDWVALGCPQGDMDKAPARASFPRPSGKSASRTWCSRRPCKNCRPPGTSTIAM